jgi:hypothetical protein
MDELSCRLPLTISLTPSNCDISPFVTMHVIILVVDPTLHGNPSLALDCHFDSHAIIL